MENMSEEILFDILLWLPVVSLLRFKTVCKSWFALIESFTFVNQHLHHHSGEDALIVSHSESSDLEFCLFSGGKYEVHTTIDFDDRFITTIRADRGSVDLVDSCDGIICLKNGWSGDVALWNPALKQLRLLPQSSVSHQRYNPGDGDVQYTIIGFGFDANVNDYKIVRIVWYSNMPEVNLVEVYNLRTSFSWRIVHKNGVLPFTDLSEDSNHATSKNGTCFWLGLDIQKSMHVSFNQKDEFFETMGMLVSFNLKDEVFETMELPDSEESCCYALDFLNDKLAYIRGLEPDPSDNNSFEIWVLHEFGVKESWNKIYNIAPTLYIDEGLYPTGFSKNGEFLLLKSTFVSHCISELFLHNLVTREECYLPIKEPNPRYLRFYLHYNESLVSLRNVVNGGDE